MKFKLFLTIVLCGFALASYAGNSELNAKLSDLKNVQINCSSSNLNRHFVFISSYPT